MRGHTSKPWTVSQAKTNLSAIMKKARQGEPQVIGTREQCVLIPLVDFQKNTRIPLGTWLIQESAKLNLGDADLSLPSRADSRPVPFSDET